MPFIQTAFLGSPGAPVLDKSDNINHLSMIRVRVTGTGVLRPTIYSMDEVENQVMPVINMSANTARVPVSLANFMQTRMSLVLETTDIDEIFAIQRISFFVRPTWAMVPG